MEKTIIVFLILAAAIASFAFYPFDLGMHMGMSTGGGTGGSFAYALLLENGDNLLIETGDRLLLE